MVCKYCEKCGRPLPENPEKIGWILQKYPNYSSWFCPLHDENSKMSNAEQNTKHIAIDIGHMPTHEEEMEYWKNQKTICRLCGKPLEDGGLCGSCVVRTVSRGGISAPEGRYEKDGYRAGR